MSDLFSHLIKSNRQPAEFVSRWCNHALQKIARSDFVCRVCHRQQRTCDGTTKQKGHDQSKGGTEYESELKCTADAGLGCEGGSTRSPNYNCTDHLVIEIAERAVGQCNILVSLVKDILTFSN